MTFDKALIPSASFWRDPTFYELNKQPAHNMALPFPTMTAALSGESSPAKISLNSPDAWRFHWQRGLARPLPTDFTDPDFDDSAWPTTPVPSLWQFEGYGVPEYRNFKYPDAVETNPKKLPRIDPELNEVGIYRRGFELPVGSLSGNRLFLVFGAVKSGFHLFVNGKHIGYSQSSMLPAEFDITEALLEGENQITALVYGYTSGSYLEDQDMWYLMGIFREVYLVVEPEVRIADIWANTSLTDNYRNGTLALTVEIAASGPGPEVSAITDLNGVSDYSVEAWLGKSPDDSPSKVTYGSIPNSEAESTGDFGLREIGEAGISITNGDRGGVVVINHTEPECAPWSAESPNLYRLVVALKRNGEIISVKTIRIGFRKVEIDGNVLKFNGQRLVLRGVNRHEWDPDHGWTVPEARYREDLYLMKRANINAIRTAHYPNRQLLYDLADELGFYVMDEADVETHGLREHVPDSRDDFRAAVVDRAERMVLRDRSHACVFSWSLGNEAGEGDVFASERAAILELDQSRPIHYEGDIAVSDFISRMYPLRHITAKLRAQKPIRIGPVQSIANAVAMDEGPVTAADYATKPVLYCEFAHAMENSLGDFAELCADFNKYPHMCGGFIWDWVDQAIRLRADSSTTTMTTTAALAPWPSGVREKWLYGGDLGEGVRSAKLLEERGGKPLAPGAHDGYFCINGIVAADRQPHPAYFEVKKVYSTERAEVVNDPSEWLCDGVARVRLLNHNAFVALGDIAEVRWTLTADGNMVGSGSVSGVAVPPGASQEIAIPLPAVPSEAGSAARREYRASSPELVLTVSFHQKDDRPWALAGFERGFDQFILNRWLVPPINGGQRLSKPPQNRWLSLSKLPVPPPSRWLSLSKLPETDRSKRPYYLGTRTLTAGNTQATFRKGVLVSLKYDDDEMLTSPVRPIFHRALTDNDRGLSNAVTLIRPVLPGRVWAAVTRVACCTGVREVRKKDGSIAILTTWAAPLLKGIHLDYLFRLDGQILVHFEATPLVRGLPRTGIRLGLTPEFTTATWYGHGPQEAYWDRRTGARIGLHQASVDELHHPYVRPQENGHREQTRWLELVRRTGAEPINGDRSDAESNVRHVVSGFGAGEFGAGDLGVKVTALGEPFGWGVSRFSPEQLEREEHDFLLRSEPQVTVQLDAAQVGVGGDWPGVRAAWPEYRILAGQRCTLDVNLAFQNRRF
ncbi:MAG: DUF4981 domain-containing protein [Promicromonosporaceae bacterium]|nr:DUF4981 domain-containing protein [Promicromonosporaceae bacterium]